MERTLIEKVNTMQKCMRLFTPHDYAALADLINISWPAYPTTIEQLSAQDEAAQRHPEAKFQRYVVEHAEKLIASGHYEQPPRFYEPGRFRLHLFVHPHYQKQGLGSRLLQQMLHDLEQLQARSAWTRIREDMSDGVRFATKHNFSEELRIWESRLDIVDFDPAPFTAPITSLSAQGIEIQSLQTLEHDVERVQKLYALIREVGQDLPPTEHWIMPSYEDFQRDLHRHSPKSYFIAVHQQRYIGVSYLNEHRAEIIAARA